MHPRPSSDVATHFTSPNIFFLPFPGPGGVGRVRRCRTIGQIGRTVGRRGAAAGAARMPNSCCGEGRREKEGEGGSNLPSSFLPSFLPCFAPLFRFRVWNWEASKQGKEGRSGRGNKEVLSSCGCRVGGRTGLARSGPLIAD